MRNNSWILWITVMSVVLGMLLAVSLKTQRFVKSQSGIPTTRLPGLATAYRDTKQQNEDLRKQIGELEKKLTDYQNQLASHTTDAGTLNQELQDSKFLAGLTSAVGPGIVVTLQDSPNKPESDDPLVNLGYIIHDTDILDFVNELRAAGAEAISVQDQRMITTSAIRCVGPVTQINGVEAAPPYEIKAIGDPKTLESALRMRGGIVDKYPDGMVTIRQDSKVVIKPYTGSRQFKWARPVQG